MNKIQESANTWNVLYQRGYRDGFESRNASSDDRIYALGYSHGRDDSIWDEYQRDRMLGEDLR